MNYKKEIIKINKYYYLYFNFKLSYTRGNLDFFCVLRQFRVFLFAEVVLGLITAGLYFGQSFYTFSLRNFLVELLENKSICIRFREKHYMDACLADNL